MKRLACCSREIEWLKSEKYKGDEVQLRAHLKLDLVRLKQGEPLDYVIGSRDFLGCKIDLSSRPLIPRAETEFWVEQAIKELSKLCEVGLRPACAGRAHRSTTSHNSFAQPIKVLDLFAGSGCIGLAVLKHIPNAHVTFAEKDPKLCSQIKKNLKLNALKGRVIRVDIFSREPRRRSFKSSSKTVVGVGLGLFDIIFANPPYVPTKRQKVQKSVKDWEPKEALFAGVDGLVVIKKFLKQAQGHLNPAGRIYLEFGYGQKTKIEKLIKQFGYGHYQFHQDQFGKWRWVVIK
jgi:release factor glutamine methyltransferase